MARNKTALANAIGALADQLNQNRGEQPDPHSKMFKKIAQVRPPVFKGGADPSVLTNWQREFDKIFVAGNCPENMKVDQAAMYLKEEADDWWRDNSARLKAQEGFGWEAFKAALEGKFYPPHLRKQKAQEFINLQMGSMTIYEYYNKFTTLAKFAPEVVATDELKAQRFEQGLTRQLQRDLGGKVFKSLDKVYERAAHLYGLSTRYAESSHVGDKRKDSGNSGSNPKRARNGNNAESGNRESGNSSGPGNRRYFCKNCKKNHPGRDCEGNLVTCRYCQKKGHREYECFSKKRDEERNGNGQNRSNTSRNQGNRNNQGNSNGRSGGNNNNNGNTNNSSANNSNNNSGNNNNQGRNSTPGRLSVMGRKEAERSSDVVTGTFSIYSLSVNTLFDSGATYSFISTSIVTQLNLPKHSPIDLSVCLPTGKVFPCNKINKNLF